MKKIIILTILICVFSACEKAYVEQEVIPDTVSFSDDIIPIFNNNCTNCHASGSIFPGLILTADVAYDQLSTDGINAPYLDLSNPVSSTLYVKMTTNMPPAGLVSASELEMILVWIGEGAKNN